MSTDGQCPFCNLPESRVWLTTPLCVALFDGYPVAEGHALVIPRRHVASLFDLPLLRVPVRHGYAPAELVALIQPFFGTATPPAPAAAEPAETPGTASAEPLCPKCGAVMATPRSRRRPSHRAGRARADPA